MQTQPWRLVAVVVSISFAGAAFARASVRPTPIAAVLAVASGMPRWRADDVAMIAGMALTELPPPPPDLSNRVADNPQAAALGAQLFVDPRLSVTGAVSCASCHREAHDFADDQARARGIGLTARRSMSVRGSAYTPWLFWDGRADSPWAQALGPLENAAEHGGTRSFYVHVVAQLYRQPYEAVFGALPLLNALPRAAGPLGSPAARDAWHALSKPQQQAVNRVFANLGKSIAAFERTLLYPTTRFDRYAAALAQGERPVAGAIFSRDEAAGLELFVGKAQCVTCHTGPRFTDDAFHNTGVPEDPGLPPDDGRRGAVDHVLADEFNCTGVFSDAPPASCGELQFMLREGTALVRAYRTPSLRGVGLRAPYMHAGQLKSLAGVLNHYNEAPTAPRGQSELHALHLTLSERTLLVQFLETLSPETGPGPQRLAPRTALPASFVSTPVLKEPLNDHDYR